MSTKARHRLRQRGRGAPREADRLRDELALEKARGQLKDLLHAAQSRFESGIERYLSLEAAIRAEPIEEKDIDFEGKHKAQPARPGGAAPLAKDAAGRAVEKGAEEAGPVGWAACMVGFLKSTVDSVFAARHSKVHRGKERVVIDKAREEMTQWMSRIEGAIAAAQSIDELRALGQGEVLPMLAAARDEVQTVEEIQRWVIAAEIQDHSYTAAEQMDLAQSERAALGSALEREGAE